jgi:hypothetical protein
MVQEFDWVQMRVSGCSYHYESLLPADVEMKIKDQKKKEGSG